MYTLTLAYKHMHTNTRIYMYLVDVAKKLISNYALPDVSFDAMSQEAIKNLLVSIVTLTVIANKQVIVGYQTSYVE